MGTVRFDKVKDIYELSWTVAPEHRRKGYGRTMVQEALKLGRAPLVCLIRSFNQPSIKIALACGFVLAETREQDTLVFKLPSAQSKPTAHPQSQLRIQA